MKYETIQNRIVKLENGDFNLTLIDEAKNIKHDAYMIYLSYLQYGIKTDDKYDALMKRLDAVLFNKIKIAVPDLNASVMHNVLHGIYDDRIRFIEDIYAVGDNVLVKGIRSNNFNKESELNLVNSDLHELDSREFLKPVRIRENFETRNYILEFIVTSINNFLGNYASPEGKCLTIEDNEIMYSAPDLHIYTHDDFDMIKESILNNNAKTFKMLALYNKNNYRYFKIEIRNGYLVVKDCDENTFSLAECFTKDKTLKK